MVEKVSNWECLFVHHEKGLFFSVFVDDIKLVGRKTFMWCGKYLQKLIWENQHLSLIMYDWEALKVNMKQVKILLLIAQPCLNREFPWWELKNFHTPNIFVFLRCPMMWKVMPGNVWSVVVSSQTWRLIISPNHLIHVSMTITSKRKNWNLWENCQKYDLKIVLKYLYLTRIGRPDILWSVNKLARSITKWTRTCDKRMNRLISCIHHTCEY